MSDRLWRRRYGADPSILSRSILLDGRSYEVIGAMPPEFDFPTPDTDLWLAVQLDPARLSLGGFGPLGIGRLKPGVTVEEAGEGLKSLVPRLADRFPGRPFDLIVKHAGMSPRVTLLKEEVVVTSRSCSGSCWERLDSYFFQQQVNDRLEALPGVRSVGAITCLPLAGCGDVAHVMREGMDIAPDEVPPPAEVRGVTDGYFAAMGISLLSGRTIDRSDHERRTRRVVVSKTLAEHFWPGESAIGKRIYPGGEQDPPWYTVAGVVSDVPRKSLMEEPTEILYLPMLGAYEAMHAPESLAFALKVGGPPEALAAVVREEIWAMDPNLRLASVQTMRSRVSDAEAPMAFTMVLLGIAAVVALILGAIGVYGVLSYVVTQRRGEIGVRMALGATAGHVSRMILRLGVGVAAIGVVLGLGGALALTRLMQALLFNVRPTDLLTYSVVSVTLFVALVASYIPARRAAR